MECIYVLDLKNIYNIFFLSFCFSGSLVGGQFVYHFNNDYWMMHISLISAMAMCFTTALAKTTPVLYSGKKHGFYLIFED